MLTMPAKWEFRAGRGRSRLSSFQTGDALSAGRARWPRYPLATQNLHHEIELVVALVVVANTFLSPRHHSSMVTQPDLTRRDIQARAKEKGIRGHVGFDQSAVAGAITPATACGHLAQGRIYRGQWPVAAAG